MIPAHKAVIISADDLKELKEKIDNIKNKVKEFQEKKWDENADASRHFITDIELELDGIEFPEE
jgi:hypothetical protein